MPTMAKRLGLSYGDMPLPKEPLSAEKLLGDDHAALDKLLKTLLAAFEKAEAGTIFERLDRFWARLAMHIRAEHLHLFPAILNRLEEPAARANLPQPAAETRKALARLRDDHDFFMHELAAAIQTARTLKDTGGLAVGNQSRENVRASVAAVSKRLESHNEIEEELVYRLPAKVLTADEQRTLAEDVQRELENLPQRFRESKPEVDEK